MDTQFVGFPKIPRLSRDIVITEKLDGTSGCIYIGDDGEFLIGSRTRWITPENDNHGFAKWAMENRDELMKLGSGHHYGEFWGQGIQRNYGLKEKRFSLFNVTRWAPFGTDPKLISVDYRGVEKWQDIAPACCHVVPILFTGPFDTALIELTLAELIVHGSHAVCGFPNPEGIVIWHSAGNLLFKKSVINDEKHKGDTT